MERSIINQIKRIPILFTVLITIFSGLNIYRCYLTIGKTEILNVSLHNIKTKTHKVVNFGENHFTTGTEGRLYWKVKNFKEAFLVNLSDINGVYSFIDLFYFLVLNGAIYFMLWNITEQSIFSDQLIDGANIIAYAVIFYASLNFVKYLVAESAILNLTSNNFTAQYRNNSITPFILFAFLMLIIPPFLKKGKSLQQEQDLTI